MRPASFLPVPDRRRAVAGAAAAALLSVTACGADSPATSTGSGGSLPSLAASGSFGAQPSGAPVASASATGPSGTPTARASRSAPSTASATAGAGQHRPTKQRPLRVLVTGDSMLEVVGQFLSLETGPSVRAIVQPHYSTGLVREDFFNWPEHASGIVEDASADVVIFMIGGNDVQNIRLADRRILPMGSRAWAAEYERRARRVMSDLVAHSAEHVYWVAMPPAKSPRAREVMRVANQATAAAARSVPGVWYVDIWHQFATASGGFREVVNGVDARQSDGVHLSRDGAKLLAERLGRILHRRHGVQL